MIIHDTECPYRDQVLLNITHSKLPCNWFYYTHPFIYLLCCSVKNDVIASNNDVYDELYGDTTEDSCELWGVLRNGHVIRTGGKYSSSRSYLYMSKV